MDDRDHPSMLSVAQHSLDSWRTDNRVMDFGLPMSEWTDEMLDIYDRDRLRQLSVFAPLPPLTLGEETQGTPTAEASLSGYSLDTSCILPTNHRVSSLRQQWSQNAVTTDTISYPEGGVTVIEYQGIIHDVEGNEILTLPITYETYKTLNLTTDENGYIQPDDWRAFDDPAVEAFRNEKAWWNDVELTKVEKEELGIIDPPLPEWRATEAQEDAIEHSPRVITEDRMNSLEPSTDGAGRPRKFRADTRFPEITDPETGKSYPQPEFP